MRSLKRMVLFGVTASLLVILVPQTSHGLVLFPDFEVYIAETPGQGCESVTFTVKRGTGLTDIAGLVLGYGTNSRVDLRYLSTDGTYKVAQGVATWYHRFTRPSAGETVTLQWDYPPDADFDTNSALPGTITVIVDPDNRVIEDPETNNSESVDCLSLG